VVTVRKLMAAAAAVLVLLAAADGARAEVVTARPAPSLNMVVSGTLEYVKNLESPHYEVGGWAITAPDFAVMSLLAGKQVTVTGRPFSGVSLLMRRQLTVSTMTATLEGTLEAVDGHYELEGFIVKGLESQVQALAGARVEAVGAVVWRTKGPPTLTLKDLQVKVGQVFVNGQAAALPVPASVKNGTIMLPLRAIIEGAGGQVTWDPELWAVRVQVGSLTTTVSIGSSTAGAATLSAAPYLENGHTMAPLDLFAQVGLDSQWVGPVLHLQ
jgi:hypothetical protein